jgi:hypothetical protein
MRSTYGLGQDRQFRLSETDCFRTAAQVIPTRFLQNTYLPDSDDHLEAFSQLCSYVQATKARIAVNNHLYSHTSQPSSQSTGTLQTNICNTCSKRTSVRMSNQTPDDAVQIHAWTAVGAMTPEAILARIDQHIIDKRTFTPSELAALRRNFQAVCDNKGQISKAEFTNFVLSKSSLPAALAEAVSVLFDSLCYLSRTPLQSTSSSPPTTHLTIEELTRALMWLLPSRVPSVITETSSGLMRSPADHRRLMFQSLATSRGAHAPEETRSVASRHEPRDQGAEINADEGADDMYHDILDTLASTQPYIPPSFAPPSRDTFHALATELHDGAPSLASLAISTDRLTSFLLLLLANNFLERLLDVDPDLEAVARAMAASFCHGRQDGQIITWEMFEFAAARLLVRVKVLSIYLKFTCYQLFSRSLTSSTPSSPCSAPSSSTSAATSMPPRATSPPQPAAPSSRIPAWRSWKVSCSIPSAWPTSASSTAMCTPPKTQLQI